MQLRDEALKYGALVVEVAGCLAAYTLAGYPTLVLLPFPALLLVGNPHIWLISSLSYCFLLSTLLDQPVLNLLAVLLASAATARFIIYSGVQDPSKPVYTLLLFFAPLYVVSPRTLIVVLASAISLFSAVAVEYYRLSKSSVKLPLINPTAYLNDYFSFALEIKCPGQFRYRIELDDKLYAEKAALNNALDSVKIRASRLGLNKHTIRAVVQDPRQLARVEHGPYTIEYTVVPRFAELYKRAQRVLREYSSYIALPLIARLIIQVAPTSTEGAEARGSKGAEPLERDLLEPSSQVTRGVESRYRRHFEVRIEFKTPQRLLERASQIAASVVGEYLGVREYTPGDSLRLIHWKKSARRSDTLDLAVKVYSASDVDKYAASPRSILVADLTATNAAELDLLLQTLYSYILSSVETSAKTPYEFYLYLVTPKGETYLMRGKPVDVLLGLNALVVEGDIVALYSYSSWPRFNPPVDQAPEGGALKDLVDYYEAYGAALVKDLKSHGVEGVAVAFVYPKALSFKYGVVASVFTRSGYYVASPGASR